MLPKRKLSRKAVLSDFCSWSHVSPINLGSAKSARTVKTGLWVAAGGGAYPCWQMQVPGSSAVALASLWHVPWWHSWFVVQSAD